MVVTNCSVAELWSALISRVCHTRRLNVAERLIPVHHTRVGLTTGMRSGSANKNTGWKNWHHINEFIHVSKRYQTGLKLSVQPLYFMNINRFVLMSALQNMETLVSLALSVS